MHSDASGARPAGSVLSVGKFYHPRAGGLEMVTRIIAEEVVRCGGRSTVACFDGVANEVPLRGRAAAWPRGFSPTSNDRPSTWTLR